MALDYTMEIRDHRVLDNRFYLVIAELHGADDLMLIFKVDESGNVVGSYQRSML